MSQYATCYLHIDPIWNRYGNLTGCKISKMTTLHPSRTKPMHGTLVIKTEISVPDELLLPLNANLEVPINDSQVKVQLAYQDEDEEKDE